MTVPAPEDLADDRVFGISIAEALIRKGIGLDAKLIAVTAARIVKRPSERRRVLTCFRDSIFALNAVDPESVVVSQVLLANLGRNGSATVRLPICPSCQLPKVVKRRDREGKRICLRCAERADYAECASCLRMKKIVATGPAGNLCQRCSPDGRPLAQCSRCRRHVTAVATLNGESICLNCYPKKTQTCVGCGRNAMIASTILHGPHCMRCYNQILRVAKPCPDCSKLKILAFLNAAQVAVCAACAGQSPRFACRRCGSEEHHYGRFCAICNLKDRAHEILGNETGDLTPPMRQLYDYLIAKPRPAVTLKWLNRGRHTGFLQSIAHGQRPLTEETFAGAPQDKALAYLRAMLAYSGALPQTAPNLTRLEVWFAAFLSEMPSAHATLIEPYARWVVFRKARRDAPEHDITRGARTHAQVAVRGIHRFLSWLDERAIQIDRVTQPVVEEFMSEHSSTRWLPQFLNWFSRHNTALDIRLHTQSQGAPKVTLDESGQRKLIQGLLDEDSVPVEARFAGLFIAVFGQSATRVLEFRRDQLLITDDAVHLILHQRPVTLPERLGDLARDLARKQEQNPPSQWLFPGRIPGEHRNQQYLTQQLRKLGTSVSELQNAARFQLAGTLPAKVLADMLGFHVEMFEAYARLSNGTWGDYPSLRATRRDRSLRA